MEKEKLYTQLNYDDFKRQAYNIIFSDETNAEIGKLEITKEGLKFTGKADESAKVFFDCCLKNLVDEYIKEQYLIYLKRFLKGDIHED